MKDPTKTKQAFFDYNKKKKKWPKNNGRNEGCSKKQNLSHGRAFGGAFLLVNQQFVLKPQLISP